MKMGLLKTFLIVFSLWLFLVDCARAPFRSGMQPMRVGAPAQRPVMTDDIGFSSLLRDLEEHYSFFKKGAKPLRFGDRTIEARLYQKSIARLIDALKSDPSGKKFDELLASRFDLYEVYGSKNWGEVLVTSYYTPLLKGSATYTERYSQPLYAAPDDIVEVDLGAFGAAHPELKSIGREGQGQFVLKGRLVPRGGRTSYDRVVPYFDRSEIDGKRSLRGKSLEMVWVDPIDAFFLQIQGSGIVQMDDGREYGLGFAAQNGYPFVAIGRYLYDVIPKEEMSLQRIESHLRGISDQEKRDLLDKNPSYVFFKLIPKRPYTYSGIEAIAGRSIATDRELFPKGALAYLKFEKPIFASSAATVPNQWEAQGRFVFDHDTGGAIRGPGRVDLYWGIGDQAKQSAGVMKNPGQLSYLVPSELFVKELLSSGF